LHRLRARSRHCDSDVSQERRLIPAPCRLGMEVAREQIGPVGLQQQAVGGDFLHQRQQVCAAALVTDPAGDADRQIQLEVAQQLRLSTCEAVRDSTDELRAMLPQDRDEVLVRIPLVQKYRLADSRCQLELAMKRTALRL